MKKPLVTVSDHAVIRYAERVLGIDMERLRREIGRRVDRSFREGACGVTAEGYTFRVQDGVVTTVLEASRPDLRLGRQRAEPKE
jgi:hypothetical protein